MLIVNSKADWLTTEQEETEHKSQTRKILRRGRAESELLADTSVTLSDIYMGGRLQKLIREFLNFSILFCYNDIRKTIEPFVCSAFSLIK